MKALGLTLAWAAMVSPALAQEEPKKAPARRGFDAGDFHFAPRVKLKGQFDDNIFLVNNNAVHPDDEFYIILQPSIKVDFTPDEKFEAHAAYEATQWWAQRNESANRVEHDGSLSARWEAADPFYLRTDNRVVDAIQPIDSLVANQVEIVAGSYMIAPGLAWAYDTAEVEVNYRRLDSGESIDRKNLIAFFEHDVWQFTGRYRHTFTDEFSAGIEPYGGTTDFFGTTAGRLKQDNEFWGIRGVALWTPVQEVALTGTLEYNHRDYRRDTGSTAFTDDFSGILFNVGLAWKPTDMDRFSLAGGRRVAESAITNFVRSWFADIAYTRMIIADELSATVAGSAALGIEATDVVLQDRKLNWSGQMIVHWQFEPGWLMEAGGEYRDKRTNDRTGEFENWRATLGVGYTF